MAKGGSGGRRPRLPTDEEVALWLRATRDVRTSQPRAAEPSVPGEPTGAAQPAAAKPAPPPAGPVRAPPRASRRLEPHGPVDLDRRSWQRLRRGLYPVDARLDLHGMTQAQAYEALTGFLAAAQARGNRCVLVITGRGLARGGTLRAITPCWLDEPPTRDRVLAYGPARLQHGGEGALYVLLRRRP
jgi:DNA-nicking Smr family endonuclease